MNNFCRLQHHSSQISSFVVKLTIFDCNETTRSPSGIN